MKFVIDIYKILVAGSTRAFLLDVMQGREVIVKVEPKEKDILLTTRRKSLKSLLALYLCTRYCFNGDVHI